MPAVAAPATALLTGANGFLGVWTAKALLEEGYRVRGTVRSAEKGEALARVIKGFGFGGERFGWVVVRDVLAEGAFDEAVEGVDVIVHTLSPNMLSMVPSEVIGPAIQATLGILKSAQKHADTVKRVVITGSIAAIMQWRLLTPTVYDEAAFNDQAVREVEGGLTDDPVTIYCASKTKAERLAWAFMEEEMISAFDLVFLNGSCFFGPHAHPVPSLSTAALSLQHLYLGVLNGHTEDTMFRAGSGWIDVRDVARAHVLAAQKSEAGGQRIIVSASDFVMRDLHEAAVKVDSTLPLEGNERAAREKVYMFDTRKMHSVLGLQPRGLEESMRDSLAFYKSIPGVESPASQ